MTTSPTEKFRRHPALAGVPLKPETEDDFQYLDKSIAAEGVREPLTVIESPEGGLLIVDGLHRFAFAEKHGLAELPYRLASQEEATEAVCTGMKRIAWTKSAIAYRLWPLFADRVVGSGGDRRSKEVKRDRKSNPNQLGFEKTMEQIAVAMGVCIPLAEAARDAHLIFAKRPALRAEFEGKILSGELAVSRVPGAVAGKIEYEETGKRKAPRYLYVNPKGEAVGIMPTALVGMKNGFKTWDKLPVEARAAFRIQFIEFLASLPEDVRP